MEGTTTGRSSPDTVSTSLQQVAELAKKSPEMVMTTLAHHIDGGWSRHRRHLRDILDQRVRDGVVYRHVASP